MESKNKKQAKPASILEMNPEGLHELDGAILDHESYERHTHTASPEEQAPPAARPQPVFAADPVHTGWQETPDGAKYPVMGMPPALPQAVISTEIVPGGSGSYLTSFMTSYLTSFTYTSGSYTSFAFLSSAGSAAFSSAAGAFALGGYGLELI